MKNEQIAETSIEREMCGINEHIYNRTYKSKAFRINLWLTSEKTPPMYNTHMRYSSKNVYIIREISLNSLFEDFQSRRNPEIHDLSSAHIFQAISPKYFQRTPQPP